MRWELRAPISSHLYWSVLRASWCQSCVATGAEAFTGQSENVITWQWHASLTTRRTVWMSTWTCTNRYEGDQMKVKREIAKSFAFLQESSNVLCLSLVAVHQQTSKGRIPNIVWQFEWPKLGDIFDFTMLKKEKCVVRLYINGPWGEELAGGSREEASLEWTDLPGECVPVIPRRSGGCDIFTSTYSCHSNSFHCEVELDFRYTIQDITNVNRVLDSTGDKSVPHKDFSTASTSRGTVNEFYGFGSQSLGLIVFRLWLSQQFFWVRYRIPPVSQPQDPKPLILRACLSWGEKHKALYREISHEICTGVLVVPSVTSIQSIVVHSPLSSQA